MKKYLIMFISLMTLLSCTNKQEQDTTYLYKVTYKVYYSNDNIITKTMSSQQGFHLTSVDGTNYLTDLDYRTKINEEATTAPIQIIIQTRTNTKTNITDTIK